MTTYHDGYGGPELRPIPAHAGASIGDFARYPGCRLMLACVACSWARSYNPERVIRRLHELKSGGHATRLQDVAKRVGWNCPACRRANWRMQFAWPANLTDSEHKRLTNRWRN